MPAEPHRPSKPKMLPTSTFVMLSVESVARKPSAQRNLKTPSKQIRAAPKAAHKQPRHSTRKRPRTHLQTRTPKQMHTHKHTQTNNQRTPIARSQNLSRELRYESTHVSALRSIKFVYGAQYFPSLPIFFPSQHRPRRP